MTVRHEPRVGVIHLFPDGPLVSACAESSDNWSIAPASLNANPAFALLTYLPDGVILQRS